MSALLPKADTRQVGPVPLISDANGCILGALKRGYSAMRAGPFALAVLLYAGAALAAGPMASSDIQTTFFDGKPFTASTPGGTQFKMNFLPDGTMTREPRGKLGKKSSGIWKLDTAGFCTTWKGAETSCYTILPSGNNKWSVQKGSTMVAVWAK
jgi:hypothetical protein